MTDVDKFTRYSCVDKNGRITKCSCERVAQRQQTKYLFKSKKQAMKGGKPCFSDFKISVEISTKLPKLFLFSASKI